MNRRTLIVAASALALGSCAHQNNSRLTIGTTVELPALSGAGAGIAAAGAQPSVTTIERANWEPLAFDVPIDGTAHRPTYVRVRSRVQETPRQRGDAPTPESSLDLVAGTHGRQRREALTQPFRALGNALLVVPRMVYHRPWKTVYSPREAYQRDWLRALLATDPAPPQVVQP
ncbi:MAG: hypothetical protein ACKVU4_12715 [Phycisphaerales bacterium]